MFARLKSFAPIVGLFVGILAPALALAQATLLPNAVQSYTKDDGTPAASGSIDYYVPSTTTRKNTWRDSGKTQLNPNPVLLDAAGRPDSNGAGTYGDGIYRQILKDADGNVIWDAVTSSVGGSGGGGTVVAVGDGMAVGTIIPFSGFTPPTTYLYAAGQAVSRVTYATLFTAISLSLPITCSSGSPTVSGLTDTQQVPLGAPIEVACFAPGTTVISKTSTSITFSTNATSSVALTSLIFPYGNGDGSTTFNLPDMRGNAMVGRTNMNGGTASTNLISSYCGTSPDATGAICGDQSTTLVAANLPPLTFAGTANQPVSVNTVETAVIVSGGLSAWQTGGGAGFTAFTTGTVTAAQRQSTGLFTATGTITPAQTSTPFSRVQPSATTNFIIKAVADTTADAITEIIGTAPIVASLATTTVTISLAVSGVTAGNYGSAQFLPVFSVDQYGRMTAAAEVQPTPQMTNVLNIAPWLNGLAIDATPVAANDYVAVRRASDGAMVRVSIATIGSAGVAGVSSLGGQVGVLGIDSTLLFSGTTLGVVTTALTDFSSVAKGVVPASGGGTTNFLRADGTWAAAGTQWVTTGSDIYYSAGDVGIGAAAAANTTLAVTGTYSLNANWVAGSDITAALNAALIAYDDIQLPCATFLVSGSINFARASQRLRGCGIYRTQLQVAGGTMITGFVVTVPSGIYGTTMEDLAINVNAQSDNAAFQGCAEAVNAVRTTWTRVGCYNLPNSAVSTAGAFQFRSSANTLATGSTGSVLRDCFVYGMQSTNPLYNAHMVEISYSSNVTVSGCEGRLLQNGVNISASDNVVVSNNTMVGINSTAPAFPGVRCANTSNQATITGNTISGMPRGIMLIGCQNSTVSGNSIKNTQYESIMVTSDGCGGAPGCNSTPTYANAISGNAMQDTCLSNTCSAAIFYAATAGGATAINNATGNTYITISTPPAVTMIQLSGVGAATNGCTGNFTNVTLGGC